MKEVLDKLKEIGDDLEKKANTANEANKVALKKEITEHVDSVKAEIEKAAETKNAELEAKLKTLSDQADALEAGVKKSELEHAEKAVNFLDSLKKELTDKLDSLKTLKGRKGENVSFNLKAAGTMLISTHYSGGTVGLSSWDSEFARIQRRKPFLRELVRVIPTDNQYIAWAEQANPDPGVAGTVNEGAAKPQTDFDIVERNAQMRKIAVWIKVSKEMLADVKFLQAEINQELLELVRLKLDEQILSGDGSAPNLAGILDVAPTFAAGSLAGTIPNANRFDVIRAAVAQIAAANFTADYVLINPVDAAIMELTKDEMGRYLMPPFQSADGTRIAGLQVVENNGVAAGTFVVGDMKRDTLAIREEINIQIGYENDDFTKNLVTILAEVRAANYIKTNYLGAFVQGTFATAIAALNEA